MTATDEDRDDTPAMVSDASVEAPRATFAGTSSERPRAIRGATLLIVAVVLGWSYEPSVRELVRVWAHDPNYSHGFLVVPVALWILWRRLSSPVECERAPWGWGALAAVLAARAFFHERGDEWREAATLIPAVACLTLTFGGRPLLLRAWPSIAFLAFLLPLPPRLSGVLSHPLQHLATSGSCSLARLSGLWVMAEGQVIVVGADRLEVADACNGLSMLMCLAATVTAATTLVAMANWNRVVLLAGIVPIALFSNIVRIVATAWCYHLLGAETGGRFAHDIAGWLMMPLAMLLVGLELICASWLVVAVPAPAWPRLLELTGPFGPNERGPAERRVLQTNLPRPRCQGQES